MELRTIQCLLWISLVSATDYSSKCPLGFTTHYYPNYHAHHQYHMTRISDPDSIYYNTRLYDPDSTYHNTRRTNPNKAYQNTRRSDPDDSYHYTRTSDSDNSYHNTRSSDSDSTYQNIRRSDPDDSYYYTRSSDSDNSYYNIKSPDSERTYQNTRRSDPDGSYHTRSSESDSSYHNTRNSNLDSSYPNTRSSNSGSSYHNTRSYNSDSTYQHIRRSDPDNSHQSQDSANARSIPVSSDLQRIQEMERRRIGANQRPKSDSSGIRTGNSSKIVNRYPVRFTDTKRGPDEEQSSHDNVIFPGSTHSSQGFVPTEIPEECQESGFCEDIPNYPEDHVATIISRLGNDRNKYKVDVLDQSIEIAQRIGPPEEEELCRYSERIATPKAIECTKGQWRFLVNNKSNPLQAFRVELCSKNQRSCSSLASFRFGYVAYCKQKYIKRYMTLLNENGESVDEACTLPSCCSCVVKQS